MNKLLCFLGFHKWNFRAIIEIDDMKVFSHKQTTLEVKRCDRCNAWNVPVQCIGLSQNDLDNLMELDK